MLNWITNKIRPDGADRGDHPLGSEDAIREFVDGLSASKPETGLLDISEWLSEPAALSASLLAPAAIRAAMRLDEAGNERLAACWNGFLAEQRVDHLAEQKLKALEAFYQGRYAANLHCLRLVEQRPDLGGSNPAALTGLLSQRAINALVGRLRVMRIRYRAPDAAWWSAVTDVLKFADKAGIINLKQRSYADDAAPSSPWLELLVALFFEISPLGNCRAQQMELVLRVLRWLEPNFMVQDTYSPQSPFYVRLDWVTAPTKTIGAIAPDPKLVFFGPGMAYGRLVTLRAALKNAPTLPDWLESTHCTQDQALAIIDALIMHWSERPPQRRHKRQQASGHLMVANGFANMRRVVAYSEFARSGRKVGYKSHLEMLKFERRGFADAVQASADEEVRWQNATPLETLKILETAGDRQMMDDWELNDISETGLGATSTFLKPWMVIGAYVAYRIENEIDWQIGILRRIHRTGSGHPSLGLEVFNETPRCAQVRKLSTAPDTDPWQHLAQTHNQQALEDAIVLSMSKNLLLIPTGLFASGTLMALIVGGSHFPIRLLKVAHHNVDCDCVQFEICEGNATP